MIKNVLVLLLLTFLFLGCASMQVNNRLADIKQQCDSMLGKTQEEVILELGTPDKIENIGSLEIYKYYISYGQRSNATAYYDPNNPYINSAYGSGKNWEAYDKINIYFKDNKMIKWDTYVQR